MAHRLSALVMVIAMLALCFQSNIADAATADDLTSASITGSVVDVNGAVVSDVKITVINDRIGFQRSTVTDNLGLFEIPFLRPGAYTLTAQMKGFATVLVDGIDVQSGFNRKIAVVLQPGLASQTIRIDATPSSLNTSDATLKYSIGSEQVESTPIIATLAGRNMMDTIPFLVPGILPGFSSGQRGEGLVVNGARPLSNVFMIDGGDNNNYELNKASSPFPNPDAVQELDIITHNYKADIGGATGGVFNVVTKSGGNHYHGNARYLSIVPVGKLNTFGGQLGGPLIIPRTYDGRNRTHFFVDYEGNQVTAKSPFLIRSLTDAERAGDFSALPADKNAYPRQPIDPVTGDFFPGGKIPLDRFDPLARLYLDRFMKTSPTASGTFEQIASISQDSRQLTSRVDHSIGNSDTATATYLWNLSGYKTPTFQPTGTGYDRELNHNLVLRETHMFSSLMVNEVTGALTYFADTRANKQPGFTGVDPQEVGFNIRPQTTRFLSLPAVSIDSLRANGSFSFVDVGSFSLKDQTSRTFSVKDNLITIRGNHTITLGGSIRWFLLDKYLPNDNGVFQFSDRLSGNGIADFLLGLPSYYDQSTGSIQHQRQIAYSFFSTDSWKLRPNLSVNLGLRYELTQPVTDTKDQVTVFRSGQRSARFPMAPLGQLFPGDADPVLGRVPRGGYRTDKNDFAPRVALAYSPSATSGFKGWLFGYGKSSIRAGFGVFYAPTYGSSFSDYAVVPPFSSGVSLPDFGNHISIGSFSNPFGSIPNPFPMSLDNRSFALFPIMHTFDPTFRSSYTYQYNLTIQRQLPWNLLLELSYVGNNSFKLDRERELYSFLTAQESSGRARYDSFQARLSRRFTNGLQLDGSYVFSKSLDNASSPWSPIEFGFHNDILSGGFDELSQISDPFNWARSSFDRRQTMVASFTYDLPGHRSNDIWGIVASGWRVGGFTVLRTGAPMEITSITDGVATTFSQERPDIVGPYRRVDPHELNTFTINGVKTTGHFFFDPTVFRPAPPGVQGSLGRNVFDGPGSSVTSISIAKRHDLTRSQQIEFRADILNLFDHANFGAPSSKVEYADFGQVSSYFVHRSVQLSLRYRF
jgi:carboxypeptidase family protein